MKRYSSLLFSAFLRETAIDCPVRLVHGSDDEEVPYSTAMRMMEALRSGDVSVTIIKGGSHFMDREEEYSTLITSLEDCVSASSNFEYDLTSPGSG